MIREIEFLFPLQFFKFLDKYRQLITSSFGLLFYLLKSLAVAFNKPQYYSQLGVSVVNTSVTSDVSYHRF